MSKVADVFQKKSVALLFAYSPTGLGHLRVTDALYEGLPKNIKPLLLTSQSSTVTFLHRLTSVHPILRSIFEWTQQGVAEDVFAFLYRKYLQKNNQLLYKQLVTIIDQHFDTPSTLVIVSTHFGLNHQLAQLKPKIEHEKRIKVVLVSQVTDDSPQHIWYAENADLILVPSYTTKEELEKYGRKQNLKPSNFQVLPYPISPHLTKVLSKSDYEDRLNQLSYKSGKGINMCIPISGAAVGMRYFTKLIDRLHLVSDRFNFDVVVKSSPNTQKFISQMLERPYVNLHASAIDKEVVNKYENLYQKKILALEVTKPSEQAFKALCDPNLVGGSILLFSNPVGRQEYDNLDFLTRHDLLPKKSVNQKLIKKASEKESLSQTERQEILSLATTWRGLRIPTDPNMAANFIWWCMRQDIFPAMLGCRISKRDDRHDLELSGIHGVEKFWTTVASFVEGANIAYDKQLSN